MRNLKIIFIFIALISSDLAFSKGGNNRRGKIKVVGNRVNTTVLITQGESSIQVCNKSSEFATLAKLDAMVINFYAEDVRKKKKTCLMVHSYELVETPTGKMPITGILERFEGGYTLKTYSNTVNIDSLLPGMEKLVGQKIVVSVDKDTALTSSESIKLHSYMLFPKIEENQQ